MQLFFLSRIVSWTASELSVQEMSETGLSMACDLHLCSLFLLAEKEERIRFV